MPLTPEEERDAAEYERRLMAAPIAEKVEIVHEFRDELREKYADDPEEMSAEDWAEVNEMVVSYERQHIDHVMYRLHTEDLNSLEPLELYDFLDELFTAVTDNRKYALERYNFDQPQIKDLCRNVIKLQKITKTARMTRETKKYRNQKALTDLAELETASIADFLLDEADNANIKSFYLPPDTINKLNDKDN